MTFHPGPSADIPAALAEERAGVEALVAVLAAEREALGAGETDRLETLAPRKRELLVAVAACEQRRARLLQRCVAGTGRKAMEAWLAANKAERGALESWRALLELAQRAQRLNLENGAFINAGMHANQQALSALLSAARSTSVYGPGGHTVNPLSSRPLASA